MSTASTAAMPETATTRSRARGWTIGLALALLVNAGVPLLLSHLSHRRPLSAAPLATRRVVAQPLQPAPTAQPRSSEPAAAQIEAVVLPALDLPSLSREVAAIALPPITAGAGFGNLPMEIPEIPAVSAASIGASYDEPPQRLSDLDLNRFYPRAARLRGTTGETVIRLSIANDGTVGAVEVLRSTPPGIFEKAAQELGRAQRFLAARKDGKAVASTPTMTIVWTLER